MTYNGFMRKYLPKTFEEEKLRELKKDPEAYGRYLAQRSLEGLKEMLEGGQHAENRRNVCFRR